MIKNIKLKKGITKRFIGLILLILTIIISIIAIINIKKLDILPDKYFYILIGVEVLINIIIVLFLLKLKKLVWFILGIILVIIMNISNILIANYTHKTNKFINNVIPFKVVLSVLLFIATALIL